MYKSQYKEKINIPKTNLFIRLLQKRIRVPLYGDPEIIDYIVKSDGRRLESIKYYVGTNGKIGFALNFDKAGLLDSIDFYIYDMTQPRWSMDTNGIGLAAILPIVTEFIQTRKPVDTLVFAESTKLKEAKTVPFKYKDFVKAIPDSKNGIPFKQFLKDGVKDPDLQRNVGSKKFQPIVDAYTTWAKKNKQKPLVYQAIRLLLMEAFMTTKMAEVERVYTYKSKPQKELVDSQDAEYFAKIEKYKLKPEEIYKKIDTYVESVANGLDYSLIIAGSPGVGKTFGVTQKLQSLGFQEIEEDAFHFDDEETADAQTAKVANNTYIIVKGKISTFGMYDLLYKYNGALIVFDDCDSVFKDGDGRNLIKGATDDKPQRKVGLRNLRTVKEENPLPPAFIFTGRVIFITNLYFADIEEAIISRGLAVELRLSFDQIIERLKKILPQILSELPIATMAIKNEVLDFLVQLKKEGVISRLDFRTFNQSVKDRLRTPKTWKRIVADNLITKMGR